MSGHIIDTLGVPVEGARIRPQINGIGPENDEHDLELPESQDDGSFVIDLPGELVGEIESLSLDFARAHFKPAQWVASAGQIAQLNTGESLRLPDIVMERQMTAAFWVATLTFAGMLIVIAFERLHNTMAALLGVAIILSVSVVGGAINPNLFIFDFDQAISYVDFNVIFLVMGMMIVISVIEETGIFHWLPTNPIAFRAAGSGSW